MDSDPQAPGGGGKADGETCPNDPAGVVSLAAGQVWPGSLAVDDTHLYWLASSDGTSANAVWRTSRCAGGTAEMLADGQSVPTDLVLDASSVYWVTYDAASHDGTVMKVAKSGGTAQALASQEHGPNRLAVRGGDVYYMTLGALKRVPAAGGSAPTPLAPISCPHGGLVADATHLYWTEDCVMFGSPRVARWSTSGTQTVLLDAGQQEFAADATHLYWTRWTRDGVLVERVEKNCGGWCSTETIAQSQGYAGAVAVDDDNVYFTTNPGNTVWAVTKTGGTPVAIATNPNNVSSLAVAGGVVYWTVQGVAGEVFKAPVP